MILLPKRLSDRLARFIDWRINHLIPIDRIDSRLGEHHGLLGEHQSRLDGIEPRVAELERVQRDLAHDLERLVPMISAQESQLESLREKLTAVPAASGPEAAEARSLIDEIRREHAQIRVRLTGIARYEERLRRLEDRAAEG